MPRECYYYGVFAYFSREFPQHGTVVHAARSIPSIKVVPHLVRGLLLGHCGGPQSARGDPHASRIGDPSDALLSGRRGDLYAIPGRSKVKSSNVIITGIISMCL